MMDTNMEVTRLVASCGLRIEDRAAAVKQLAERIAELEVEARSAKACYRRGIPGNYSPCGTCQACREEYGHMLEVDNAKLKAHLRNIHDRAHSWNNIPACSDIEYMAAEALGLKGGA